MFRWEVSGQRTAKMWDLCARGPLESPVSDSYPCMHRAETTNTELWLHPDPVMSVVRFSIYHPTLPLWHLLDVTNLDMAVVTLRLCWSSSDILPAPCPSDCRRKFDYL